MKRLCLTWLMAVCSVTGSAGLAADITLRDDLRPRLAQLWPIYGEWTNVGRNEPVVRPAGADGGHYYGKGLQIYHVSGTIDQGDAQRLADLIGPEETVSSFAVTFDSPGGNFLEGVKIGELLRLFRAGNGDPALNGVIVLNGDECMSACAVAFALAALPRDSGNSVRYVELGGRLGFHMPFVPVDQQARQTEIAAAMDLTYQIMSEYIQLIGNGIAPSALVQNALHYRRPDDFLLLQGGLVTRFMDFVPVAGPKGTTPLALSGLTQRDALNMCQYLTYSQGRSMIDWAYEFWPVEIGSSFPDDTPLTTLFERVGDLRLANDGCSIEWQEGDTLGIAGAGDCGRDSTGGGWCAAPRDEFGYVGSGGALPRATGALLADSLGCHGGKLTRRYYTWDASNRFLEEEQPAEYRWSGDTNPDAPLHRLDWSGARLASNLNIRTAPGGDPVARWTEGTPVQVLGCTLAADGQGVWYQVAAGGVTGWASARYIDVPALSGWDFMIRPLGGG
ncbi:SH3 domain-containing protein [Antarctobacter sp.]|uniref:SH3 domain-containing protein n=1 Tax=Antarctobacter sp. TaxID=1872577 RepID=UPI002B26EF92|nr:SH3 domain-containing protein [Antarctobacter sp.]